MFTNKHTNRRRWKHPTFFTTLQWWVIKIITVINSHYVIGVSEWYVTLYLYFIAELQGPAGETGKLGDGSVSWATSLTGQHCGSGRLSRSNSKRQSDQYAATIQQRRHHWIGHILSHESLLLDIMKRQMKGRPTRGRRRLQLLVRHGTYQLSHVYENLLVSVVTSHGQLKSVWQRQHWLPKHH